MDTDSDQSRLERHRELHRVGGAGPHPEIQRKLALGAVAEQLVQLTTPVLAVLAQSGDTQARSVLESVRKLSPEHSLDEQEAWRAKLVDLGWTPPGKPSDQPQVPVMAWMHPKAELVSVDPHAYTGLQTGAPRELVFKSDVVDHIEWLEKGVAEWRSEAVRMMNLVAKLGLELAQYQKAFSELEADAERPVVR